MTEAHRSPNSAMAAVAAHALAELRVKMVWLNVFRTVAAALILAVTGLRLWTDSGTYELSVRDASAFAIMATVFFYSLILGLILRREQVNRRLAWIQVIADVLIATSIVALTGGAESPFSFAFLLAVLSGAIVLNRPGAQVAVGLSTASLVLVSVLLNMGLVKSPLATPELPWAKLVTSLSSNVLAQALVATLAWYLADQLVLTGGRLSAREADLREIVGLQNQIVNAMPSGLITCDAQMNMTFMNPAAALILHIPLDERGMHTLQSVLPGVERLMPSSKRAELSVDTPDGPKLLGLSVTPLEGSDRSWLLVFQDLTDLRRMQEELQRIDHLASLGKLSAQLAHEIRNPLASMRGSAQMLADDVRGDETKSRLTQVLLRESDRLGQLVDGYLDLARPPPPVAAAVDLRKVVSETIDMVRADPLALGVRLEDALQEIEAPVDAGQMRQVLINLMRNAFLALQNQGSVKVTLDTAGNHARIVVWDSAGSIKEEHIPHLFEPFFTTRPQGTGLGLSTVNTIVKAHGGRIVVKSNPEQGTSFTLLLPLRKVVQA